MQTLTMVAYGVILLVMLSGLSTLLMRKVPPR